MIGKYPIGSVPIAAQELTYNNLVVTVSIPIEAIGVRNVAIAAPVSIGATATMFGVCEAEVSGTVNVGGSATLVAVPMPRTMTVSGSIAVGAGLTLTGGRTLQVAGTIAVGATAALASPNTLRATAEIGIGATATLAAENDLQLSGSVTIGATAVMVSPNTLQVTATIPIEGAASLVHIGAIATAAAGAVTAWAVNLATGGHSTYSNFSFNSFFRLGADYYGCNDSGIYKLTGDVDVTAPIDWKATTAITTFGIRNRKYVHDARVVMRTAGDVSLKTIVGEQLSVSELTAISDDKNGFHARRIKIPKGLNGTAWQFELSGSSRTDIEHLVVDPLASQRT